MVGRHRDIDPSQNLRCSSCGTVMKDNVEIILSKYRHSLEHETERERQSLAIVVTLTSEESHGVFRPRSRRRPRTEAVLSGLTPNCLARKSESIWRWTDWWPKECVVKQDYMHTCCSMQLSAVSPQSRSFRGQH